MATILTKKKDTSGAPSAGDLTNDTGGAELAVNTADKRLYTKDSGGNVVEVGTNPSTINIDAGSIDGTPIGANSAAAGSFTTLNTSGAVVFNDAGADVDFRVEGDTDANLLFVDAGKSAVGIGTTIADWDTTFGSVAQVNDLAAIASYDFGGGNTQTWFGSNVYYNGGYKYITSNPATRYAQNGANHIWQVAASGTAGNAITFTQAMTLDASGNLLVGTTTIADSGRISAKQPSGGGWVHEVVHEAAGTQFFINFRTSTAGIGSIQGTGTATNYNTSSDYRLKENVAPMTGALAKVAQLNPCTYTWKVDGSAGQGFIAHELQAVCPDAVTGEKDGEEMQGVDYGKITPLLTAALQEAIAEIQSLKARVAELEAK